MSSSSTPPPAYNANGSTAAPPAMPQRSQFGSDWDYVNSLRQYQDQAQQSSAQGNYIGAAQAQANQGQQNTQAQTQANRPDQNTAFGFSQWHQNPDGSWVQNTGLNGPLSGALGSLQTQAAANAGKPFDDGSAARDQAITGAYNQATSRLDPQFNQRQEQLGAQLANQGLDPNSAAYRNAMQQFGQQRNDAYGSAMNSAIGQGTAAQQATFGENMAAQMAPYQQMQQLFGLGQAPGFQGAGRADPAQLLAAITANGNYNLGNAQQQNEAIGSGLGAIGSAAGAAAGFFSDERLKQSIERYPVDVVPGVPLASFEYRHQPGQKYLGVIAQDLERVAPQHVGQTPEGVKVVSPQFRPFSFGGK